MLERHFFNIVLSLHRHGLKMEKPQMMYWQKGLNMRYSGGSIVIESAIFKSVENRSSKYPGILISILTESPTLGDLAVIGFVTDEIDSALKNVFPCKWVRLIGATYYGTLDLAQFWCVIIIHVCQCFFVSVFWKQQDVHEIKGEPLR